MAVIYFTTVPSLFEPHTRRTTLKTSCTVWWTSSGQTGDSHSLNLHHVMFKQVTNDLITSATQFLMFINKLPLHCPHPNNQAFSFNNYEHRSKCRFSSIVNLRDEEKSCFLLSFFPSFLHSFRVVSPSIPLCLYSCSP